MNNDLISREALKEQISELYSHDDSIDIWLKREDVDALIDNAPAVEVTKPQSYVMGFCDGLKAQTYEKPPMFESSKESEIIKAYTKGFDTGVFLKGGKV